MLPKVKATDPASEVAIRFSSWIHMSFEMIERNGRRPGSPLDSFLNGGGSLPSGARRYQHDHPVVPTLQLVESFELRQAQGAAVAGENFFLAELLQDFFPVFRHGGEHFRGGRALFQG